MFGCAHNVPVLMYHHVSLQGGSLSVSAAHFEQQIAGLARKGYTTLGAADLAAFYAGKPLPKKSVLLTFDDGYLDNWVYAHPVLQRYGMRAVLFAITGLIGHGPVRPHAGQGGSVAGNPNHRQAEGIMFSDNPDPIMARWSELQAMQAAGTFEIHSHTHTHKRWDYLCESLEQRNEAFQKDLADSQAMLLQHVGQRSQHLCWPQGYFNEDYVRSAREAGFGYFYTTDARGQNVAGGNAEYIYRFAVRSRGYAWLGRRTWLATHPVWGPLYNRWKAAK